MRPVPPPGYAVRPASREDVGAVAEMIRACDVHDLGAPDSTQASLEHEWDLPDLDLARDTWLVVDGDGAVAAYAWLLSRRDHARLDGWGAVHPEHRGRSLGALLVQEQEHRAAEHRALAEPGADVTIDLAVLGVDRAGHELLESRGYRVVRHFWRMDLDATAADLGTPDPPDGIRLRPFDPDRDARAAHEVIEEAFAEHWGWVPRSFEDWSKHRMSGPAFDPTLWFVATDGDRAAGVLVGEVDEGTGWVHTLGVRRGDRRRGIGEALLRTAIVAFAARGVPLVSLDVDAANETGATALYERVGMHVARQYDVFERRLPATGP